MAAAPANLQALIIGINAYSNGIPPLKSAVNDARAIANLLHEEFGYETQVLCDEQATAEAIRNALGQIKETVTAKTRFFFYFAGHGIALDGADSADGPVGYAIPQDATTEEDTFVPMQELHDRLVELPCKHLLVVLDCCFAGSFRWAGLTRKAVPSKRMYRERFDRFLRGNARQVITSAAHDEKALDVLSRFGDRDGSDGTHSPFARLLMDGLRGEGDLSRDGVTTATELYIYLNTELAKATNAQTPGLSQLRGHDKGEFIFTVPGFDPKALEPAPKLNKRNNPYRGLEAFDEKHADLFFGRQRIIGELMTFVEDHPLTVVLGASGSGKSSLVKAGLLPHLKDAGHWTILEPMRPGQDPFCSFNLILLGGRGQTVDLASREAGSVALQLRLEELQRQWRSPGQPLGKGSSNTPNTPPPKLLLVIDQCEELITQTDEYDKRAMMDAPVAVPGPQGDMKTQFLETIMKLLEDWPEHFRVIVTLRSDFEPQFRESPLREVWGDGRFVVPPMERADLRAAILEPAAARAIYFDPPELVDRLIDEVAQTSGALPLLSFALSELYLAFLKTTRAGHRSDRAITLEDYETIGGVATSLARRADRECDELIADNFAYEYTLRHVILRMVSISGNELAKRRVNLRELDYAQADIRDRIDEMLARFVRARLLVQGTELDGSNYVEPAHDTLILGWQRLRTWQQEAREQLNLHRLLQPAIREWESHQYSRRFLWAKNPRLPLLEQTLIADPARRWFNRQETAFAEASVRRAKTRRQRFTVGAIAMIGIITVLGISTKMEEERANIREKSNKAEITLHSDTAKGTIQAVDAINQTQSPWISWQTESDRPARSSLLSAIQAPLEIRRSHLVQDSLVQSVAFSTHGDIVVTGSKLGHIHLWSNRGAPLYPPIEAHDAAVAYIAYSKQHRIISLGLDGLRLWTRQGQPLQPNGQPPQPNSQALQPPPLFLAEPFPKGLVVSPDGQYIATSSNSGVQDEFDTIEIWELKPDSMKVIQTFPNVPKNSSTLAFSHNNKYLASARPDNLCSDGDADDDAQNADDDNADCVKSDDKSAITLWPLKIDQTQTQTQAQPKTLPNLDEGAGIRSLAFSPDPEEHYLASGNTKGTVRLWDYQKGQPAASIQLDSSWITSLGFNGDGTILTSGSSNGTIQLWDLEQKRLFPTRYSHQGNVLATAFSYDGQFFFSGGEDGAVNTWDMEDEPLGQLWRANQGEILSLAIQPPDVLTPIAIADAGLERVVGKVFRQVKRLVQTVELSDETAFREERSALKKQQRQQQRSQEVRYWSFSQSHLTPDQKAQDDQSVLVTTGRRGTLQRWWLKEPPGTRFGAPLRGHNSRINAVSINPLTHEIVSGGGVYEVTPQSDDRLRLWTPYGHPNNTRDSGYGHGQGITGIAIAPNGQWMVTSSADKTLRIWDRRGNPQGPPLVGHRGIVNAVAISPDSSTIVSVGDDGFAILWDRQGNLIRQIETEAQGDQLLSVQFTPNGRSIIIGNARGLLQWYTQQGQLTKRLPVHRGPVWAIAFHPRDAIFATAGGDGSVGVWTTDGESLGTLKGHASRVRTLAFTPNGHKLFSGSADGFIHSWPMDWHNWLTTACDRLRGHITLLLPKGDQAAQKTADICWDVVWSDGERGEYLQNRGRELANTGEFATAEPLIDQAQMLLDKQWRREQTEKQRRRESQLNQWRKGQSAEQWRRVLNKTPQEQLDTRRKQRRLRRQYRQLAFRSLVNRGEVLARAGEFFTAIAQFKRAQKIAPHFAFPKRAWHTLCRFGGLYNGVNLNTAVGLEIIKACDRSIGQEEHADWRYFETRAIARILVGEFAGAQHDLNHAADLAQRELDAIAPTAPPNALLKWLLQDKQREWRHWKTALDANRNPITKEVREQKLSEFL